jgi:hypothetical protein
MVARGRNSGGLQDCFETKAFKILVVTYLRVTTSIYSRNDYSKIDRHPMDLRLARLNFIRTFRS